ncbi:hypothetical protein WJ968_34060 [Achromobacter xylosoxidans]
MGRQKVLRGEPPETLAKVLADRFELHNLKKKGYALALENVAAGRHFPVQAEADHRPSPLSQHEFADGQDT